MTTTATTPKDDYLEMPEDQEALIGATGSDGSDYVDPSRGMAEFKIVDIKYRKGTPNAKYPDKDIFNQFELRFESCKEPGATIRYWINHKPNGYYGELHKMTALCNALFPDGLPSNFRIPSSLYGMHCQLLISQAMDVETNKRRFKKDGETPIVTIKAIEPLDDGHPLRGVADPEVKAPINLPAPNQEPTVRTKTTVADETQEMPF